MSTKSLYKGDPNRKRLKYFSFELEDLMALLLSDEDLKITSTLPKDAIIRSMDKDQDGLGWRLVVQSKEFDEVAEGYMLERIEGAVEITTLRQWRRMAIRNIKK